VLVLFVNLVLPILVGQVAEPQVSRLCIEAQEFIVMGKWLELASLMITSAELIFSKVSDKGRMLFCATSGIVFIFHFWFGSSSIDKKHKSLTMCICYAII